MHEASLHERNSFLTLTLSDENVPAGGSLDKSLFPLFMKRFRKAREVRRVNPLTGRLKRFAGPPVRYFHCGEYGERRKRPHYHAVIFGEDFSEDRVPRSRDGKFPTWESPMLSELWGLGHTLIGSVTFESAAYVARYICTKVTGPLKEEHYATVDVATGEIGARAQEYVTMSRGSRARGTGGIGRGWFERYSSDVFPEDEVISRGRSVRPPRFYDQLLERADPEAAAELKRKRDASGFRKSYERSPARLAVRERCTEARMSLFQRSLEL